MGRQSHTNALSKEIDLVLMRTDCATIATIAGEGIDRPPRYSFPWTLLQTPGASHAGRQRVW